MAARILDGEDIPAPSPQRRGMHAVPLPPVLAYKATLFSAMRRDGVSKSELARRLGLMRRTCAVSSTRAIEAPRWNGCTRRWPHAALPRKIMLVDTPRRERLLGPSVGSGRETLRPAAVVATRRIG